MLLKIEYEPYRKVLFAVVSYNSIHTKNYCRELIRCRAEIAALTAFLRLASRPAAMMLAKTDNAEVKTVRSWRHRCGAQPRYYTLYYAVNKLGKEALYYGNGTWNLLIVDDGRYGHLKIYTDGCYTIKHVKTLLSAIASEDVSFFISSPHL